MKGEESATEIPIALEERIILLAEQLRYPATPEIAAGWTRRSKRSTAYRMRHYYAWGLAAAAVLCLVILAVTPLRAGIAEWLRLGAVRIQLTVEPSSIALDNPEGYPELAALLPARAQAMTLAEAAELSDLPLAMPRLLPSPDAVFRSGASESEIVSMVWDGNNDQPALVLQLFGSQTLFNKLQPLAIDPAQVNGEHAIWTTGPYLATLARGEIVERVLIKNHALIWQVDNITYRLESALSLADAQRIAESLVPIWRMGTPEGKE